MEAKNVSTQPRNSVEGRPLEVKAEGVVLASRRGESGAVVDEVNIVRRDGDEFEFCLELSVSHVQTLRVPQAGRISTSLTIATAVGPKAFHSPLLCEAQEAWCIACNVFVVEEVVGVSFLKASHKLLVRSQRKASQTEA